MSETKTLVALLIDETGSMQRRKLETCQAVDTYIRDLPKKTRITLARFNSNIGVDVKFRSVKPRDMRTISEWYTPTAMTPLHDAIAKTIIDCDEWSKNHKGAILFVIVTDGEENASREYNLDAVKSMIDVRTARDWQFVFIGAGLNAFAQGHAMGIARGNVTQLNEDKPQETMSALSLSTRAYVESGSKSTTTFWNPADHPRDKHGRFTRKSP